MTAQNSISMSSYSSRFSSKSLLIFIALTIIVFFLIISTFLAKIFFAVNKGKIEKELSGYLSRQVSIESIRYLPPNSIILKNVSLSNLTANSLRRPFSAEKITLLFSLPEFISKKRLVMKEIYFNQPKIDLFEYPLFFKENIEKIIGIINQLAEGRPLKLAIEDASLILYRQGKNISSVFTSCRFMIGPRQRITSTGIVSLCSFAENMAARNNSRNFILSPIEYNFGAVLTATGMAIEDLELKSKDFHATFDGELKNSVMTIKGFSTLKNIFHDFIQIKKDAGFLENIKKILQYRRIPRPIGISVGGLNILDIDCRMEFASQKIKIDNLSFSVNNIPFLIRGELSTQERISIALVLKTFSQQSGEERRQNQKRLDLELSAEVKQRKLVGKLILDFAGRIKGQMSAQRWEINFAKTCAGFTPDKRIKIFINELAFISKINDEQQQFVFNNVNALINFLDKQVKLVIFDATFCAGFLQGYAALNISPGPLRWEGDLIAKDLNIQEFATPFFSLLHMYSDLPFSVPKSVFGKVCGKIHASNYPAPGLIGEIEIKNGYLDELNFFVWLADFFNLPELKRVDFGHLSGNFSINSQKNILTQFNLDSEMLKLMGYFNIDDNDLVSSKLSLLFPHKLLVNSAKFQLLLALLGERVCDLSFDFQLSGTYQAINFKWLESDFKTKLKKFLPNFMEKEVERKIENIIKSIVEKE